MSDANEAVAIAQGLQTFQQAQTAEQTKSCVRSKKMICSTAPNGEVIGVKEAFASYEMQIPYLSEVCDAEAGNVVWVTWTHDSMSTAVATRIGEMTGGNFWTKTFNKIWDSIAGAFWERLWPTAMLQIYPIGTIYTTLSSENPRALFGGTWVAYGQGRVLVGIDGVNYTEPGLMGGVNEVYLTVDQLASHYHSPSVEVSGGAHSHGYTLASGASVSFQNGNGMRISAANVNQSGATTGSANANVSVTVSIGNTGGSQAHENRMPYITVYMWQRIA